MPSKRTIKINVMPEVRDIAWELTLLLYPHREVPMSRVIEKALIRTLRIARQRQEKGLLAEFKKSFGEET